MKGRFSDETPPVTFTAGDVRSSGVRYDARDLQTFRSDLNPGDVVICGSSPEVFLVVRKGQASDPFLRGGRPKTILSSRGVLGHLEVDPHRQYSVRVWRRIK